MQKLPETELALALALAMAIAFAIIALPQPFTPAHAATPPPPPPPSNLTAYNYLSIQGPNSTTGYNTAQCGQPPLSQPNSFGQTYCFDMPLLAQQDLNSQLVGKVQGTFVFIAQAGGTLFVSESFTINTTINQGTFTGVGLEQLGQFSSKPITGGTGDFAFVSGVAYTTPLANGTDTNGNYYSWFMYQFTFH